MTRWIAVGALGVLALACSDGAPVAMDTEDESGSRGTSGSPDGSAGSDATSAPDDTGPMTGAATGDSTGSNDTTMGPGPADSTDTGASTGGCMPGVFDDSRFDEACFQ